MFKENNANFEKSVVFAVHDVLSLITAKLPCDRMGICFLNYSVNYLDAIVHKNFTAKKKKKKKNHTEQ